MTNRRTDAGEHITSLSVVSECVGS